MRVAHKDFLLRFAAAKRPVISLFLVIGVAASIYAAEAWRAWQAATARTQFAKTAADYMVAVRANVLKAAIGTGYLGTVFESAETIDRTGFDHFAATVMKSNPIIERLAWLPVVKPEQAAPLARDVANNGRPFLVTEKDWAGRLGPASPRSVYYPIAEIAPRAGNESLIGFDFGSGPDAHRALDRAAATGGIVTMPNVAGFIDSRSDDPSYFVVKPVFAQATHQLRGFVIGQVDLLGAVRFGAPTAEAASPQIAIFDLSAPTDAQLFYPARLDGVGRGDIERLGGSFWDIDMGVAVWRIAALPATPLDARFTWQSVLVLLIGLAITANFAGYLLLLSRRRQHIEQMVHTRTQELETTLNRLQRTEDRLRDYIDTASDWYWEVGPDLRFTSVADRAMELGIDLEKLIGLEQLTDGDAIAHIEKRMVVLSRHEAFKDFHYDYPTATGMMVLSLSGVPVFGKDGQFAGYRGSARDITKVLRVEAEQRTARWAAEQANRSKSAFLANMSHEIRTPMNGVLGMVQILRHSGLNDEQRRMCEIIAQSGTALLEILNDILDFSKLEAGKIDLESVDCCLPTLVNDVVSLMRHTAVAKGISIVFEHDALEKPWVVGDPTRLRQILLNLVSNAIKFSRRGGIFVRLRVAAIADEQLHFFLSVEDHGIGMSADEQRRLFQRFTQADASLTRRFGGTGLGLAITRELVELMGGKIAVASKQGEGSTFTVELHLPLAAAQDGRSASEEPQIEGPQAHLKILVAEDDEVNRMVIRMMLKAQGHQVALVENGRLAVGAVEANASDIDLILMDVMMPEMDGATATKHIRALPLPAAAIPIIALTANAMAGDRDTYLAAGMNSYVSKPIERRNLFTTIEHVLGVRAWTPSVGGDTAPPPAPAANAEALGQLEDFISSL